MKMLILPLSCLVLLAIPACDAPAFLERGANPPSDVLDGSLTEIPEACWSFGGGSYGWVEIDGMEIGYLSLVGTVQQNVQVSIGDVMLQVVDQEGEVTTFRYWLRNNFLIGVEAGDEVVIQYFNDQTTGISGQEMAVWKRTEAGDRLVFLGHTTEENPWGGGTLHVEVVPDLPCPFKYYWDCGGRLLHRLVFSCGDDVLTLASGEEGVVSCDNGEKFWIINRASGEWTNFYGCFDTYRAWAYFFIISI
ncbi:hypothetical protein KKC22_18195 [Myxococcota bacterium]|nr:hypothetical protein [Myxococcota bacterium]